MGGDKNLETAAAIQRRTMRVLRHVRPYDPNAGRRIQLRTMRVLRNLRPADPAEAKRIERRTMRVLAARATTTRPGS